MAAHDIVTMGLAHSPEGRRIFPRLSVEENLLLGAFARNDQRGDPQGPGRGLRPVPDPGGAAQAAGRDVLRR